MGDKLINEAYGATNPSPTPRSFRQQPQRSQLNPYAPPYNPLAQQPYPYNRNQYLPSPPTPMQIQYIVYNPPPTPNNIYYAPAYNQNPYYNYAQPTPFTYTYQPPAPAPIFRNPNPYTHYQPPAMSIAPAIVHTEISQVIPNEPKFVFIPSIEILKVRNGIIELEITNEDVIDDAIEMYARWRDCQFEFCYRFRGICKQDSEWQSIVFSAMKISRGNKFYLKTKLHLHDYQVEFKLRAKHQSQENYYPYSAISTVNVQSSLIENTYDIGECVSFYAEHAVYSSHGIVAKILDDSYLQIKYENNGKIIKIHTDRVYSKEIFLYYILDLTDSLESVQNVLLRNKKKDNDTISIFQTMNDVFASYELEWYRYYNNEIDSHFLSRFVATNVMQFLSVPYYKAPMVGCLVNESDGWMNVSPYLHHTLERFQQGIKSNAEVTKIPNSYLQGHSAYCDICSIGIHRFDWVASCCTDNICDSHVVCLSCVNNKIEQSAQLKVLLGDLLQSYLNDDCIITLVEFVAGRVIAFEKQ